MPMRSAAFMLALCGTAAAFPPGPQPNVLDKLSSGRQLHDSVWAARREHHEELLVKTYHLLDPDPHTLEWKAEAWAIRNMGLEFFKEATSVEAKLPILPDLDCTPTWTDEHPGVGLLCDESAVEPIVQYCSDQVELGHARYKVCATRERLDLVRVKVGYLTVPMSYSETDPAHGIKLKLRVTAYLSATEANGGAYAPAVLRHCGGPGSVDSCPLSGWDAITVQNKYNLLGIAQRGMQDEANYPHYPTKTQAVAMPTANQFDATKADGWMPVLKRLCENTNPDPSSDEKIALAKKAKNRRITLKDITTCPCEFPAEGVSIPQTGVNAVDPFDRTGWKEMIRFTTSRNERCTRSDIWKMYPPTCTHDSCRVNFLDYVGTQMLAQDLNKLRESIHAPKLNCRGASYGTTVCNAFVASYAEHVGLVELNGVAIGPTTNAYYETMMAGVTQGMRELVAICERANCTGPNPQRRPEDAFDALVQDMYANPSKFSIVGKYGLPAFTLTPSMVYAWMMDVTFDVSGTKWLQKLSDVLELMKPDKVARDKQIRKILDDPSHSPCYLWDVVGSCIFGLLQHGLNNGYQAYAVRASDFANRFTVERAFKIYDNLATEYESSGVAVAYANQKALQPLTWPIEAAIAVVGGRAAVKVLVVSSAYDMATPLINAIAVRSTLPDASLMVWQGVGHCVDISASPNNYDPNGVKQCTDKIEQFWLTGKLPVDGFTCRNSKQLTWPPKSADECYECSRSG